MKQADKFEGSSSYIKFGQKESKLSHMRRKNSETATYKQKRNLFSFIWVLRGAIRVERTRVRADVVSSRARLSGLVYACVSESAIRIRTDYKEIQRIQDIQI
jgi:hypothetical protein